MKIQIINKQRNELLKRNEVIFSIDHEGNGTPSRSEIKWKLAETLDADEERLFLRRVETKTGSTKAVGKARVYDSVEQARYVEPEHIISRNTLKNETQG